MDSQPTSDQRIGDPREQKVSGHILVVDDNEANVDMLSRRLRREGYQVSTAQGGVAALERVEKENFDLMLLDIMMPDLDGFQVLSAMKSKPELRDLPVIVISAIDEMDSVVRAIELGAEDFLPKPFDAVLLRARIGANIEKKRLRDREKNRTIELEKALAEVEEQRRISESLLLNILPRQVAKELRDSGSVKPRRFDDVTIVFTDFVRFAAFSEKLTAEALVAVLDRCFTAFDRIVSRYKLEKLKTIGDSYMIVGGLPTPSESHAVDAVLAAFDMIRALDKMEMPADLRLTMRVGVHTGPVVAGVVGVNKFAFDVWGDSVNYSSRVESAGAPNRINLSEATFRRVESFFACEPRGLVTTKDNRECEMYFVNGLLGSRDAFEQRYRRAFSSDIPWAASDVRNPRDVV